MTAQNVVSFRAQSYPHCWRQEELQRLVALHSVHGRHNGASWSVGKTELGDPQFYMVGDGPAADCMMCVTRIGRLYVLEDGRGTVVAEDARLERITDAALRMLRRPVGLSFVARSLIALCAVRAVLDEKIDLVLAESMEYVTLVAPELAALV